MKTITKDEYLKLATEDRCLLEDIFLDLSPENLTCDGELPSYLIAKKASKIHKELKKMENKLNRVIYEDIVYENILPRNKTLHFNSWNL